MGLQLPSCKRFLPPRAPLSSRKTTTTPSVSTFAQGQQQNSSLRAPQSGTLEGRSEGGARGGGRIKDRAHSTEGEDAIFSWFKGASAVEDLTPMRDGLDAMERRIRHVEEDWTEVYNKFRTLQMRVAKQVQRLDANSSHEEPQKAEGDGAAVVGTGTASSLSPRMQRIQEQILERRRRGVGVLKEGGE